MISYPPKVLILFISCILAFCLKSFAKTFGAIFLLHPMLYWTFLLFGREQQQQPQGEA